MIQDSKFKVWEKSWEKFFIHPDPACAGEGSCSILNLELICFQNRLLVA